MSSVVIDPRYNGPPGSANGGYTCGVVAGLLGTRAATVTLRVPPPLGHELTVSREADTVRLHDGDALVAEGTATAATAATLPVTDPVGADTAAAAVRAGLDAWRAHHPFPTCFVCGPAREPSDGLEIFPCSLGDGRYASPWSPDPELAGADGAVAPEYVWASLDCPTAAPCMNPRSEPPVVLARLTASLDAPVRAGEPHVLVSWPLGADGRKRYAGATLFDAQGTPLASSEALWIELRPN